MKITYTKKWVRIWNSKQCFKPSTIVLAEREVAEILGEEKSA